MTQRFEGYEFCEIGPIEPLRDENGVITEEMPQSRFSNVHSLPLNKYGTGPFCRFRIARGQREAGVYLILCGDEVVYVGECQDLQARYNSNGYGGISPRNCFKGGQETNCRINSLILDTSLRGEKLKLVFCSIDGGKSKRLNVEAQLVTKLGPNWNR